MRSDHNYALYNYYLSISKSGELCKLPPIFYLYSKIVINEQSKIRRNDNYNKRDNIYSQSYREIEANMIKKWSQFGGSNNFYFRHRLYRVHCRLYNHLRFSENHLVKLEAIPLIGVQGV